jgi:uncharacterized membrane protein
MTGVANSLWFLITYYIIMCGFYLTAVGISFRAYKEFKGMFEDENQSGGNMNPFSFSISKEN